MAIINSVIVSGGGSAPAGLYREFQLDGTGKLIPNKTTTHIMDFTGVTDVDQYMLAYAYFSNTAISGAVDMSDLTTVSGNNACLYTFRGCTGLTSADLSSLTTITAQNACNSMFQDCERLTSVNLSALTTISAQYGCGYMFKDSGLTSIDLPALTTISGGGACNSMFQDCRGVTSVNLSALTTVSGLYGCQNMFTSCIGLTSIDLPALTTITGNQAFQYMFSVCTSLATVYIGGTTAINFGSSTSQFAGMFLNCPQNIDVYAPAANQAQIEAFSGYPNFGGTGTVTWHWRS